MSENFNLPNFLVEIHKESIEKKIMLVLGDQHPLTLEEILALLEIKQGTSCNRNHISIVLKELVMKGILENKKNVYAISKLWLKQYGDFIRKVCRNNPL